MINQLMGTSNKKVAVVGGGPAGITAAYQLAKAGIHVDVYEASDSTGGLAKTLDLWGQKVDIGPHRFFSNDKKVNSLWLEVVGDDYKMVNRLTRIYYKNKFFHYPLKPFDALFKIGIANALLCITSYLRQQVKPAKEKYASFEEWVTARFGKKLYTTFFKTYSEKLWGIPCDELDADFAAQRIKNLSLWEAIKDSVNKKKSKHKTLVDQFAYPLEGSGMVYKRMEYFVNANGGRVFLKTPVKKILVNHQGAYGIELPDNTVIYYDEIISTMPLTQMVQQLDNLPAPIAMHCKELKFRNTIIIYLSVKSINLFNDNWLYIHEANLKTGRITNFRNWVPEITKGEDKTIIAMEYWCNNQDELWNTQDEALIAHAKYEFSKTGLAGDALVEKGFVYKIPNCYPVYAKGYKKHLKPIEEFLSAIANLSVIGRYGSFKYNNQDHSILMGMLAAENIITLAKNNLWEINTDYEDYQERSTITASGLIIQ